MKKITLLLTAVFVLSAAALYAQQYNSESDFLVDWDEDVANTVIIKGYVGSKTEVRIPPKIQNNTVTKIYFRAFDNQRSITSVTIPNGVTSIGSWAFDGCTSLTSVTIPDSVTYIGELAFRGCTRLTSVTIPSGVRIRASAFSGCTNLTSVTFKGRANVEDTAFAGNFYRVYSDGPGTYTRFAGGEIWKQNFTPQEVAARDRAAAARAAEREAAERQVPTPVNPAQTYKIGDQGPAGGIVFYDKGEYKDGWRYMEVAPNNLGRYRWGRDVRIEGTGVEIGAGKKNTEIIVARIQGKAAEKCKEYFLNGYRDWFLPSKDELYQVYKNLTEKRIGGIPELKYWSSSSFYDSSSQAWFIDFSNGRRDEGYKDTKDIVSYSVLPVRAF